MKKGSLYDASCGLIAQQIVKFNQSGINYDIIPVEQTEYSIYRAIAVGMGYDESFGETIRQHVVEFYDSRFRDYVFKYDEFMRQLRKRNDDEFDSSVHGKMIEDLYGIRIFYFPNIIISSKDILINSKLPPVSVIKTKGGHWNCLKFKIPGLVSYEMKNFEQDSESGDDILTDSDDEGAGEWREELEELEAEEESDEDSSHSGDSDDDIYSSVDRDIDISIDESDYIYQKYKLALEEEDNSEEGNSEETQDNGDDDNLDTD